MWRAGEEEVALGRGGCDAPGRRRWMWRAGEEEVALGRGECGAPGRRRWMWCAGEEVSVSLGRRR